MQPKQAPLPSINSGANPMTRGSIPIIESFRRIGRLVEPEASRYGLRLEEQSIGSCRGWDQRNGSNWNQSKRRRHRTQIWSQETWNRKKIARPRTWTIAMKKRTTSRIWRKNWSFCPRNTPTLSNLNSWKRVLRSWIWLNRRSRYNKRLLPGQVSKGEHGTNENIP